MDTMDESSCCREVDAMTSRLQDDDNETKECITDLEDFKTVCLNPAVLQTAYNELVSRGAATQVDRLIVNE